MSFHQQTDVMLVVPGLLGPIPDSFLSTLNASEFRRLSSLLAVADCTVQPYQGYFETLYALFEPVGPGSPRPSVAAVCRYAHTGQQDAAYWLRIDPVHLMADKDRLYMFGTRVLALQAHETEQLICALQELYADRDWHFESYRPDQWYLRLAADAEVRFHSLEAAIGHPIDSYMPEGKERDYWLRFLNEVQMLFHGHDVNNDRLLRNEFAVNSVWCWGEGRLPATLQARWHSIYSDDLFVQGLAALCGIPCISPPESANVLMRDLAKSSKPDANRQILIVLDQVESSRLEGDASSWQEQVKCIQDQWFLPLQEAQGRGQVGSITIDVCNGSRYRYLRRHRMRVWRRTPAFGDVLVHA